MGHRGPSERGRGRGGHSADRCPSPPPAPGSACKSGWSATETPPDTCGPGNIKTSGIFTLINLESSAGICYFLTQSIFSYSRYESAEMGSNTQSQCVDSQEQAVTEERDVSP